MAGVTIGNGTISVDGQQYYIDIPGFEHHGTDLTCPCGDLQDYLASLLCFLDACGESYRYNMSHPGKGENLDLFPIEIAEWAYINSDEISMIQMELEETENLIEE